MGLSWGTPIFNELPCSESSDYILFKDNSQNWWNHPAKRY